MFKYLLIELNIMSCIEQWEFQDCMIYFTYKSIKNKPHLRKTGPKKCTGTLYVPEQRIILLK